MPIKKDGTGKRWVEMELVVPGTPEQIWHALATGEGNGAWFTKATIAEHVGGKLRFDFGPDMASTGEVTTWQPPHRFGYVEHEWNPNAPPLATEITITARSGDQCLVRMVHSLFSSTDDWDDQMESFENGWPAFFEVLKLYIMHHAGAPAAAFTLASNVPGDPLEVWMRLSGRAGIAGANTGQHLVLTPQSLPASVERVHQDGRQRWMVLRLQPPAAGVAMLGTYRAAAGANVNVTLFFYGEGAAQTAAASEQCWRSWLREVLPEQAPPLAC